MTQSTSPLADEWKKNPGFVIAYCPFLEEQGKARVEALVVSYTSSDHRAGHPITYTGYSAIAAMEKGLLDPTDPINKRILDRREKIFAAFNEARAKVSGDPDAVHSYPVYDAETQILFEPTQR